MHGITSSPRTLGDVPRLRAQADPEHIAIMDKDVSLTYAGFDRAVDAVAAMLESLGVARGDRVAVLVHNSAPFVYAYFGIARAGAVVVPIGTRLSVQEVRFLIEHSGAQIVLHDASTAELATTARPASEAAFVDIDQVERGLHDGHPLTVPDLNPEDDAAIFYTSGTTERPKGVRLSHRAILHCITAIGEFYEVDDRDVTLSLLPLHHSATHFTAWPAILSGGTLMLHEGFRTEETFELLERHRVTLFPTVTAIAVLLAKHVSALGIQPDLTALRKIFIGGAAVPAGLLSDWAAFAPQTAVVNCYGLTEMSPGVSAMDPSRDPLKLGSVGRRYRDLEVRIADPNEEGVGEVLVHGPSMMSGYWRNPEDTRAAIVDGWLHTGDLGRLDEDDYLFLVGRKKHMVKRGGENIFPNEIEAVLARDPRIKEAIVVAVPDDVMDERVGVIVSPQPGTELTAGDVAACCRAELAGFKVPEYVSIVEGELPKNSVGKIDARTLFAQARAGEIDWTDLRRGRAREGTAN